MDCREGKSHIGANVETFVVGCGRVVELATVRGTPSLPGGLGWADHVRLVDWPYFGPLEGLMQGVW